MSDKRKILLFGGSFSPPTLAHEAIIDACLQLPQFDEVWVMPCGGRTDKSMTASDEHRLVMAKLVKSQRFANNPRLHISDFELKLPRPTNTYATSQALQARYTNCAFWWALGTDAFLSMPHAWEHGAELQKTMNILLFNCDGQVAVTQPNVTLLRLPARLADISSTQARQKIAAGGAADTLVSTPVLGYIQKHGLYAASAR